MDLGLGISMCLGLFVAYIYWQHRRLNLAQDMAQLPAVSAKAPLLMGALLVLLTLAIYSQTGRFHDWNQGKVDENIDYLVAADITKGIRLVEKEPQNTLALMSLAQAYSAGGLYADAVQTLDKLLLLTGEDAEVLGSKANALYYRDQRQISPETTQVISQALALWPTEPQTRLLLATDAYLNARYSEAISHWQQLLAEPSADINRDTIYTAIEKAQIKLNESGSASSH
ncbi:tetratricopeptide repeat protein [Shewanella morhuae]|nr:tetratricopeptide repeat protein [Shewanella morhuae]GIU06596.1 nitrite reductase [Shewanella morhuae]